MMRIKSVLSVILSSSSAFSPKGGMMSQARRFHMVNKEGSISPNSDWRSFDPKDLGAGGTYGLGISAVVPRPIAVITSQSDKGVLNCAPFS